MVLPGMSTETTKARYRRLKDAHLCVSCGRPECPLDPKSRFFCTPCKEVHNAYMRNRRKALISNGTCACGRRVKAGCTKCSSCLVSNKRYTHENRPKIRQQASARYRRVRDECFSRYGWVCSCCSEANPEFLQVDHVGGDGAEHRKSGVTSIFYWLRSHNFPSGFQTLCANCNWAKRRSSNCPLKDTVCKTRRENNARRTR